MKRVLLACAGVAALIGLAGAAAAADLGRQLPVKAPAYMAPYYNWTGLYAGINGGGGWGGSTWSGFPGFDLSGGLIGGTVGYNWQMGQAVLGVEGDIDWANIQGSGACTFGCETRGNWIGTARGRLGYAVDRFMPYVTGGLAFGNFEANSTLASSDATNAGWALGAGVEFAVMNNWTAKVEYLHVDLGDFACTTCNVVPTNVDFNADIVRGGLNYRF